MAIKITFVSDHATERSMYDSGLSEEFRFISIYL
jgi:hypothetical protein